MTRAEQIAFFEKYSEKAMDQQRKYGIPASVTLAQMALESGYGKGRAIEEGNNAFCVKGTYNGNFILISDDHKDEKFKQYPSLDASFEDHSKVLTGKHYAHCRKFDSTDYKNWCYGLQSGASTGGKYATDPQYSQKLIAMIENFDLHKYDQMALTQAKPSVGQKSETGYSNPIAGQITINDLYGVGPTAYRNHAHNGIDIQAKYVPVLATENSGTVVNVGNDPKGSGKYVTVEYDRSDGAKYRVSYCHLSEIDVKKGDTLNAGQKLGVSGNTGNSTGPHLHLTVKHKDAGQTDFKTIDPLDYMAEISVRGRLDTPVVYKGKKEDLLASRKANVDTTPTAAEKELANRNNPEGLTDDQLANMNKGKNSNSILSLLGLGNQDNSQGLAGGIGNLVESLFMSVLTTAIMIDRFSASEKESLSSAPASDDKQEQESSTLVHRSRDGESIDPDKAKQTAAMNFDVEYPEQHQNAGQRLA